MRSKRKPTAEFLDAITKAANGEPLKTVPAPSELIVIDHRKSPPAEDEWILWKTPNEKVRSCFVYEYARSTPWIVNRFRECCEGKTPPDGVAWGFKPDGTWYFRSTRQTSFKGIALELPAGFPEKPYSQTKQVTATLSRETDEGAFFDEPVFQITPDQIASLGEPKESGELPACFLIEWGATDIEIKDSFALWLKGIRSNGFKARRNRAKRENSDKLFASLLFDLGVFRVLTQFDMTPKKLQSLLASHRYIMEQPANLYRSYSRAKHALEEYFNAGWIPELTTITKDRDSRRKSRSKRQSTT